MEKITPLYSKNEVTKAGKILRSNVPAAEDKKWATNVLGNWRAIHSYPINTFQATLRDKLQNIDKTALVAQRLKRSPSIVSKLKRFPDMKLSRMQDIGGLRAVVNDIRAAEALRASYKKSRFLHKLIGEKDYIDEPKEAGYRGIHMVYRYYNKQVEQYNGLQIELQIRTKLQHAWATAVETMGTFLNYALKSSEGPDRWLQFFALTGSAFALYENCNPVPGYENLSKLDTYKRVKKEVDFLDVFNQLSAFTVAANSITNDNRRGSYHIIALEPLKKIVIIESFSRKRLQEANDKYSEYEGMIESGNDIQVVLVATKSIDLLKKAYPNYFLDTYEFMKVLLELNNQIIKLE